MYNVMLILTDVDGGKDRARRVITLRALLSPLCEEFHFQ